MTTKAMSEEELRQTVKQALERLKKKGIIKDEPLPKAPYELWPGESYELGGWALAKAKLKRVAKARQAYG